MAPKKRDTSETKKKEFGTGLRAQLERRREEPDAAKPADLQPNVELRFELTARPADSEPFTVVSDGATEDLRKQLAAARARENELKAALAEQQEVSRAWRAVRPLSTSATRSSPSSRRSSRNASARFATSARRSRPSTRGSRSSRRSSRGSSSSRPSVTNRPR